MRTNAAFKLQDAGFTRAQVEALGEFLDTQAASKTDLLETEHRLEVKVSEAKTDIIKWMFGTIAVQTGLLITAFKLLH